MKRGWGKYVGVKKSVSRTSTDVQNSGIYDAVDQHLFKTTNSWPLVKKYLTVSPSSPVSLNEGSSFTVSVTTDGFEFDTGVVLYYTIDMISGSGINSSDFTDGLVSGSFALTGNSGSFNKTLVLDSSFEGVEVFVVNIRTGSTSGPIVLTTAQITINNSDFVLTRTPDTGDEGTIHTFTFSATNINAQTLYYASTLSVDDTYPDYPTSGSFAYTSGNVQFTLRTKPDGLTEGNETVTVTVRLNSTSGTPIASTTFTVVDTSLSPTGTIGEQRYVVPGTYSWTAPTGVTSVSAVCIGGGGGGTFTGGNGGVGGAGGGLGWKNNITVVPGNTYTVVVGNSGRKATTSGGAADSGGTSYFINTSTVAGFGGGGGNNLSGATGGSYVGDGGGNGGSSAASAFTSYSSGGGGAGGYSGNGGSSGGSGAGGGAGTGGAGGAGGASGNSYSAGAGGGVGIFGQGNSGAGGAFGAPPSPGGGGSGGTTDTYFGSWWDRSAADGGLYGGGGGGSDTATNYAHGSGGIGAVRLIWGTGREFPMAATSNIATDGIMSTPAGYWSLYVKDTNTAIGVLGTTSTGNFPTGTDFCIEYFVNPIQLTNLRDGIVVISKTRFNSNADTSWHTGITAAGLPYFAFSSGSAQTTITGVTAIAVNTWNHIAITRSGTTYRIFVNGVLDLETTNSTTLNQNTQWNIVIGGITWNTAGFGLPAYISNVRIVKGSVVYTSSFTVPTSPLTAITNTLVLTCRSSTFVDNGPNNYTIENTATVGTSFVSSYGAATMVNYSPFTV